MISNSEYLIQLMRLRLRNSGASVFFLNFQQIEALVDSAVNDVQILARVINGALESRDPDTGNRAYLISFEDHDLICHQVRQAVESVELAREGYEMAWQHESRARGTGEANSPGNAPADTRPPPHLLHDPQIQEKEARKKKAGKTRRAA